VNLGNILQILAFYLLGFTTCTPIVPFTLIGIAYALIPSALWPSLPIVTPESSFATASGLALSMSNIAMIPAYGFVGQLVDKYHNIQGAMALLAVVSFLGLIFGLVWHWFDRMDGSPCNAKSMDVPIEEEELLEEQFEDC
jgi:hypothetical protein